jgi:hypothetical protein
MNRDAHALPKRDELGRFPSGLFRYVGWEPTTKLLDLAAYWGWHGWRLQGESIHSKPELNRRLDAYRALAGISRTQLGRVGRESARSLLDAPGQPSGYGIPADLVCALCFGTQPARHHGHSAFGIAGSK